MLASDASPTVTAPPAADCPSTAVEPEQRTVRSSASMQTIVTGRQAGTESEQGADKVEKTMLASPSSAVMPPTPKDARPATTDIEGKAFAQSPDPQLGLKPFPSQQGQDTILVHWEGDDDPENPHNWGKTYRWWCTCLAGMLVFNSTFVSTAPQGVMEDILAHFHVSEEVGTLLISIYVAGYCLGPLIWAPMSERIGRYPVCNIALVGFVAFNLGCALSPNIGALLAFRFLVGVFGASPMTTSGGIIFDLWDTKTRGYGMLAYSLAPSAGPAIGPIVSGAIKVCGVNWRWAFWVSLIFSAGVLLTAFITLRETYAPVLLSRKANRLRKAWNDERYVAPLELVPFEPKDFFYQVLGKPILMMLQEPMLLVVSMFLAYGYGLLYLLFEFYSTYQTIFGLNALQEGLTFLPFFVGTSLCCVGYGIWVLPPYNRKLSAAHAQGETKLPPEERLRVTTIAGPALAISFFWYGWASYRAATLWAPLLSGLLMGIAVSALFLGLTTFVVEAYGVNAASALAAQTILRSSTGAALPLGAEGMLSNMGVHWASTLLAFLAVLMTPIPFVLQRWGPAIRSKSKFAAAI